MATLFGLIPSNCVEIFIDRDVDDAEDAPESVRIADEKDKIDIERMIKKWQV